MATKNITIRMDEELKEQSEKLFTALGMNMTTAITTFIKQAVREQGIPFNITLEVPNKETREAIMESEKLIANPNTKKYTNLDDLFRELKGQ